MLLFAACRGVILLFVGDCIMMVFLPIWGVSREKISKILSWVSVSILDSYAKFDNIDSYFLPIFWVFLKFALYL